MRFILSRADDFQLHSKKWVVGYGLLFWLLSRLFAMLLIVVCVAIYRVCGIDPESLTSFVGNPETAKNLGSSIYVIVTVGIVAPLLEECIFRLGLSFKRCQVALAIASIPAYILWQLMYLTFLKISIFIIVIAAIFSATYFFTTDSFWIIEKQKYYKSLIYITAIAFGLLHLIAFSNYTLILVPYMFCIISVPFFAGCAITYYRVNLGFWWGVGLHIFNNIPAIIVMLD